MDKSRIKGQVKFVNKDKSKFFAVLKERVDLYFKENNVSKNANPQMVVKTIILTLAYLGPLATLMIIQPGAGFSMLLWTIMGLAMAGIGMCVMHDANHGSYTDNNSINKFIGYLSLNLVGGSVFNWKLQHNILHHTYTNVVHMDDDIDDKLIMRFSPHTPVKGYHKLQFIYAFLFYGILTLYWSTAKDFIQFARYTKNGVNPNSKKENWSTLLRIIGVKVFYFSLFFGAPILAGLSFMQVLWGFLLMHFIAGLVLTVIFQLAHTVEGTSHPLPCEQGTIENNWAIHQLNTTVNFSRNNKVLTWYLGGLNYQVEHHLFPRICHVHYPEISVIVKETAEEYGVPYLENETFGQALRSHVVTLQRFGKLPDINEALA